MLSYDGGDLEKAVDCFRSAVALEEGNAVAHFNLGSVLDEMGQMESARQHLRLAVRLDARYADAHYNLAFACEKLSAPAEAGQHWQLNVELDPGTPRSDSARRRLPPKT